MTDDAMGEKGNQIVMDFLRRVASAAAALASNPDFEVDNLAASSETASAVSLVKSIARDLLKASEPDFLILETGNLPAVENKYHLEEMLLSEDDGDDADRIQQYQNRRSDYLRLLLRFMAPVSMQVASQVCHDVLADLKQRSGTVSTTLNQAAFLLFAHWLPVAPHLTPMAMDLLRALKEPWKELDIVSQQPQVFLFAEASYKLCSFFVARGQIAAIQRIWNWTFLFDLLHHSDVEMDGETPHPFVEFMPKALQWYAARALTSLMDWKPQVVLSVMERLEIDDEQVPWEPHPWTLEREEKEVQEARFRQVSKLWGPDEFSVPSSFQVGVALPASSYLANVGEGIFFYKAGTLCARNENKENESVDAASVDKERSLIPTETTCKNLALLGAGLCQEPHPPPIMLCGPHGSGKSSILREMLRLCRPKDSLLEFHIDEETDSKTLIGSYSTTDVPGEFAWRPGALTHASREGRWVLFEDIDTVPIEIQATIVKLLEDRMLPLGNGKYEKCHPDFRVFATCTTSRSSNETRSNLRVAARRGGGRQILSPSLWRKIHVQPLPFSELKEVATALYSRIPPSVIDVTLSMMKFLDISGRDASLGTVVEMPSSNESGSLLDARTLSLYTGGRNPSVRDLFKLLSRISHSVTFEDNATYATEAQRLVCLAESVEILVGSCPDLDRKEHFVTRVACPAWGISGELGRAYISSRCPKTQMGVDFVEIGRAKIHFGRKTDFARKRSETFAETNHALRFMESIGVCVRQNEPILLVGETGCGKTTMIQQLAGLCERELVVQNLSLQTDSTDLLGGFKPLKLKNVARHMYLDFVDLFVSTFSRKQNAQFLQFASSMLEKGSWKKLSQCFHRAAKLGTTKMRERIDSEEVGSSRKTRDLALNWDRFKDAATKFERQMISCDAGLAFTFSEGALVDAIKNGKWVLLDEINLASSDTLQRLCGLLDDPTGSVTLTERGDASEIPRHPNFRLFAAMNPATDAGKKDLPASVRSRFSELYVHELMDPVELRVVAATYLHSVLPTDGKPPEHKDIVVNVVEVYLKCRDLADTILSDGAGHKPRYTLRTLSRALSAARTLILDQRLSLSRALYEGFQLAFEGALDAASVKTMKNVLRLLLPDGTKKADLEHPGRRPNGKDGTCYELVKPFWIKNGPMQTEDWSKVSSDGKSRFILTPSISTALRRLSRALAAGPWPILLEGPTSAGKTTLVEYMAARCGHHVVRINNHEHTDVQEYTGSFAADQNGSLSFRDGLLVQALRRGYWVILDELNLAPSEVLEALNRLLDDNRELYLAETNETVKPHPDFRLFATQNPSGAYGGRKPLSRAFRNRFVELHMSDIPSDEMITILEQRCGCPRSSATRLVDVMVALRYQRSKSNLFLGKDSFITPRDLLRWAERKSSSRLDFAEQGYMLLAERLRSEEEKQMVQAVLEEHLKVKLQPSEMYYGDKSMARKLLHDLLQDEDLRNDPFVSSIAPTRSLLRLISLVVTCIEQKEPVLLVGDTGCGKTTVVQFLSIFHKKQLYSVGCHATTETSDLLGGLRPIRGRDSLQQQIFLKLRTLILEWPYRMLINKLDIPEDLLPERAERSTGGLSEAREMFSDTGATMNSIPEVEKMFTIARAVMSARPPASSGDETGKDGSRSIKRRKISAACSSSDEETEYEDRIEALKVLAGEIEVLARRYASLFEWSDGPLVTAMKSGQMLLLDEMSLAEDAVLERLNSVLEPSRTLVLAEKGDDGTAEENRVIKAHEDFRVFATMNPGGDFGKRELSPALRSRFTEIWVPAVTERTDFELVLSRTLHPTRSVALSSLMLEYVEWFNGEICEDPSSPCAGYSLSLRDILSWAHFVEEACEANLSLGVWEAYVHGAALMHLDGLGLGAGLAVEDANRIRKQAEAFLSKQLPAGTYAPSVPGSVGFTVKDSGLFGAEPFYVSVGPVDIPNKSNFNMAAPTTATNAFRVLRGLQLRKPILLEGAPGVGKTSLITALAAASGNHLVRINLSEQTDIADLMGSDLPTQDGSGGGASFEWSDGVLLKAIKDGSWVLLDELNLASQSVLEGLNSCLDHRATVYIPELGKSFHCPSTFRIFGAQNPLTQGGGRKGLPKSFLNRFTKVYVDALSDIDLRAIVRSRYPSFDHETVDCMINFNNDVHKEVAERREYGSDGAPWEFNLRDVFRWCQLLENQSTSIQSCARDLYFQRFRNEGDRARVEAALQRHFQKSMTPHSPPAFHISDSAVLIGETTLPRMDPSKGPLVNSLLSPPELFLSHLVPMEALARCVALKWPCLLIGPSSSGKTSTVATLAELCNVTLVEQCLSPSSDVSELLGCFEQVDSNDFEISTANELCRLIDAFFHATSLSFQASKSIWEAREKLNAYIEDGAEFGDKSSFLRFATQTCALLVLEEGRRDAFEDLAERVDTLRHAIERRMNGHDVKENGHFLWRDGILVEAMVKGYWLVLGNVNLCPSSVLDRLNSVMENDGELLLSECGSVDADGLFSHRVIKPSRNFRIFLTMDSVNGEISRAMRNRCVEIYFPRALRLDSSEGVFNPSLCQESRVDSMGLLHTSGIRSLELASSVVTAHLQEHMASIDCGGELACARSLALSCLMMSTLLTRGATGGVAMLNLLKVGYELDETFASRRAVAANFDLVCQSSTVPLASGGPVRQLWCHKAGVARVHWEARVLKFFAENAFDIALRKEMRNLLSTSKGDGILAQRFAGLHSDGVEVLMDYHRLLPAAVAKNFLLSSTAHDFYVRSRLFDTYHGEFTACFRWMAKAMEKNLIEFKKMRPFTQSSGQSSSADSTNASSLHDFHGRKTLSLARWRLDRAFTQQKWLKIVSDRIASHNLSNELAVLEASYLIGQSALDRSMISCPLTPVIFPLFVEVDEVVDQILIESIRLDSFDDQRLYESLSILLRERDRLWDLMKETTLSVHPSSFLGFEETGFIVQWKWLKRSLEGLDLESYGQIGRAIGSRAEKLKSFISLIDSTIFGKSGDTLSSRAVNKNMMHPCVPREAAHWEALLELQQLAGECSLPRDGHFESSVACIDLTFLIEQNHPLLCLDANFRLQLLAAFATVHSYCTTEVRTDNALKEEFGRIDLGKRLRLLTEARRKSFQLKLDCAKIDTNISTVENQLSAGKLEEMKESSPSTARSLEAYSSLVRELLSSFARIQLSPFEEFYAVRIERNIVGRICKLIMNCIDEVELVKGLEALVPDLKAFIRACLSSVVWPVNDLRPYQTLIWLLEDNGRNGNVMRTLRSLLPPMLASLGSHLSYNSFSGSCNIAMRLEVPNMWVDDETTALAKGSRAHASSDDFFGSTRIQQHVWTELLLLIVGEQFALKRQPRSPRFFTMESCNHRIEQYKEINRILSSAHSNDSKIDYWVLLCLTRDTLQAMEQGLKSGNLGHVLELVKFPSRLAETDLAKVLEAVNTSEPLLLETATPIILPLLKCLRDAWNSKEGTDSYREMVALSSIYLGLLHLTISTPRSPVDPGRSPVAKISLINRRLQVLQTEVAARRIYRGFATGDFTLSSPEIQEMLGESDTLVQKRRSQQKKVVIRPKAALPFHELFRLTRDFVENFSSISSVLELVRSITTRTNPDSAYRRLDNWMRTSTSFCQRIKSDFDGYEDVTMLVLSSVRMIQDGLQGLLTVSRPKFGGAKQRELFANLLQYPIQEYDETISGSVQLLQSELNGAESKLAETTDFHFALAAAALSRLLLKKTMLGFREKDLGQCLEVIESLSLSCDSNLNNHDTGNSLEDMQEQKFREQFPDHRLEFNELLVVNDDDMSETEGTAADDEPGESHASSAFSDDQLEFLCLLLQKMFTMDTINVLDSTRALVFHFGYNAAFALEGRYQCSKMCTHHPEPICGHSFAMMLSAPSQTSQSRAFSHLYDEADMVGFHNIPNPTEVLSAKLPLERLMARCTQLLTAFPGHSILLGVGRVCDKVCKFDIMTTPIGKVMTGMEVILRQAQEWEQHASERVRLGEPLKEVGKLVATWRKLELQSWPRLVVGRQCRYERRARKHMVRLQNVLKTRDSVSGSMEDCRGVSDAASRVSPGWVWKGSSTSGQTIACFLGAAGGDDLNALTKILDTFMLTSPLGEFEERLKILEACALQQEAAYQLSSQRSAWTLQQSRALLSVHEYYQQFERALSAKLTSSITTIQAKLKEEVKLAKWDEQTYYALAESTEKNHRKLMRILSELEESLDLNAGQLIQEERIRGVRSTVDVQDGASTTIPSESNIFPHLEMEDNATTSRTICFESVVESRTWTSSDRFPCSTTEHVRNIQKYARKMERLCGARNENVKSRNWADVGADESFDLSGAIFDRMSALRKKSTRPMKERALVDLFRELKKNGFTTTKWAVPDQIRCVEEFFQLPKPRVDKMTILNGSTVTKLQRAEKYYQRCIAELSEYRSESTLLGSKYMSKREMGMMLALGESGMWMIAQQRCVLSSVLHDIGELSKYTSSLSLSDRELPLGQTASISLIEEFEEFYSLAIESLRQLSLFFKSSQQVLSERSANEWARDTASKIDRCIDNLAACGCLKFHSFSLLANSHLQRLQKKRDAVDDARRVLLDCRHECEALACLPVECFDGSLEALAKVVMKVPSANIEQPPEKNVQPDLEDFFTFLSSGIERSLIGFQNLVKDFDEDDANGENIPLWQCHREVINGWASVNIPAFNKAAEVVILELRRLHETGSGMTLEERDTLISLTADFGALARYMQVQAQVLLDRTALFYANTSKLVYVFLRIFRVLLSKGFCSDETKEEEGSEAGGDLQGMKFEDDVEGTGMGEGDGKQDVTDQLESEEQISGLKNDQEPGDKEKNKESRQLNEEEADQGMEMEADFDGEMCDVPDKPQEEDGDDENGEELDREMGDEANADEQVVDERMWNDSDDEDEIDKGDEKFEKDSGVQGEAIEGATRTKEEEDEKDSTKPADRGQQEENNQPRDEPQKEEGGGEDEINEDTPDRYEDQHGVDVRGEDQVPDESKADDQMQLEDDINLDGEEDPEGAIDEGDADNSVDAEQAETGDDVAENSSGLDQEGEGEEHDDTQDFDDVVAPTGVAQPNPDDEGAENENQEEQKEDETNVSLQNQQPSEQETHGVRAMDGADGIIDDGANSDEDGNQDEAEGGGDTSEAKGGASSQNESNGSRGLSENDGAADEARDSKQESSKDDIPNPLKTPGDASKFWHKKLSIVDQSEDKEDPEEHQGDDPSTGVDEHGNFQYSSKEEENPTQMLGEATEEEAVELKEPEHEQAEELNKVSKSKDEREVPQPSENPTSKRQKQRAPTGKNQPKEADEQNDGEEAASEADMDEDEVLSHATEQETESVDERKSNLVVADLSGLKIEGQDAPMEIDGQMIVEEQVTGISSSEAEEARAQWLQIQGETYSLSRRLCEKLRLVMEPLVASKLRGDYRTGKRINMKRVIGYIASGYRKDKIWLRRTKPAKRDYRILLAVDDSESMKKSGAGEMALRALATLAVGMNQLEIGELGIASFGEDMKLLHPFHLPFGVESGADMVLNFKFNQKRTRTTLCVESALAALDDMGGHSSMQLVFLVSDGRIERDSRDGLKRLIREMMERNILLAMIIVEGEHKKKDSIVNMKEVTFQKGKPVVKRFIEDYPFPYYIVLEDMATLPEVLGDALRQWFEVLTQLQSPR